MAFARLTEESSLVESLNAIQLSRSCARVRLAAEENDFEHWGDSRSNAIQQDGIGAIYFRKPFCRATVAASLAQL